MIGETPIYQRAEKIKNSYILMVIGFAILIVTLILSELTEDVASNKLVMILASLLLILVGYITSRLYINGYFDRLVIQYGKFGPFKVTIQYSQIRAVEQIKIPPILRMKTGLMMKFGGWFFNPGTSADAIKIEYGKHKVVVVGTTDPDGLKNFLEQKIAYGVKFS